MLVRKSCKRVVKVGGGGVGWGPDFVWHKLKKNSFITSPLHSILCATNLKGKTSNLSSCE